MRRERWRSESDEGAMGVRGSSPRIERRRRGKLGREKGGLVRQGVGKSGANPDYVLNTHAHLVEMGVHDATLDWIAAQLRLAA